MTSSLRRSSRAVSLCDRFKFSSQRRLCVLLTTILHSSVPGEPSSLGVLPLGACSSIDRGTYSTISDRRYVSISARACKEVQTLATVNEPRGFLTVTHAEDLVGSAQVLLYRRLGEEEVLGDLCVAESLGDELQYLPLADGESVEIRGVIVRYKVFEKLPGSDDLALLGHLHGARFLIQLHPRRDGVGSESPRRGGGPSERQIHVQAEDQNGDIGVDPPDAFYALGDSLGATRVEYGATGSLGVSRSGLSNVYPRPSFQCLLETGGHNGIRAIYPDKPQTLGVHHVASFCRRSCKAVHVHQVVVGHCMHLTKECPGTNTPG